jgi:acetyl-CoA C-acetyltransferase
MAEPTSAALEPVIVDAVRTPIGKLRGAFKDVRPDDLAARAIAALVLRTTLPADEVTDVILGCANQAGEDNRNVARMALLLAGLPESVPGVTVNRLCGSGLEAILQAARAIRAGEGDLYIAGGVESMTRAPFAMAKPSGPFPSGNQTVYDTSLGWRFPNERMKALFPLEAMGETAENLAEKYGIARGDQDAFALRSHQLAVAAEKAGRFTDERIPVEVPAAKGPPTVVSADEGPREDSSLEKLGRLEPAFRPKGSVTAGNSSTLNDGAAAVVVCSLERARRHGWHPLARVVGGAAAGVNPRYMGIGPVPAIQKALDRAGWNQQDVELAELNEAFAVQALSVLKELRGIDPEKVNVNGGAIALGHPLGCSGARIVTTLVHELRRRAAHRALAAMCIGVGQGIAALFEAV